MLSRLLPRSRVACVSVRLFSSSSGRRIGRVWSAREIGAAVLAINEILFSAVVIGGIVYAAAIVIDTSKLNTAVLAALNKISENATANTKTQTINETPPLLQPTQTVSVSAADAATPPPTGMD